MVSIVAMMRNTPACIFLRYQAKWPSGSWPDKEVQSALPGFPDRARFTGLQRLQLRTKR